MTMTKIQNGNAGQKGWVNMIKLSDALERIKQECLHNDCPHCPFGDGAGGCLLTDANVIPCEWDFSVMRNADAAPTTSDNVNHPSHYTQGGVECIDALQAATVNLQGIEAVCTANAIKYLWRWKQKNGEEDLKKAQWYIDKLIGMQP